MIRLENGEPFVLEPFQHTILGGFFDGVRETLCLLPKKNGKTTLLGALSLYHLCTTPDAECVIAAASRDQASIMLRQAQGFIRRSPALQSRLDVKQREIVHLELGGRIRVLASDTDTADGVIPTLALVDELHRHKNADLYGVFRDGLGPRDGQLITISTAGADQNSALWQIRQAALDMRVHRDGAYLCAESDSGGFLLHEWSLAPDENLDDLELVAAANPLSLMTVEKLRERHDSPTMTPWQWARFACNVWTQGEDAWLQPGQWESCYEPDARVPDGAEGYLAVDLGLKHDTAALVFVSERPDDRVAVKATILTPPVDGSLDIGAVEREIREAAKRWRVKAVAYDPWRFERSAQILGDEGLLMVEFPQNNARMAPASEQLFEAVNARRIVHDGDRELARHVNAGVTTETERGWRLTKRKAKDKVDALIALVMAYDMLVTKPTTAPAPSRVPFSF